MLKPLLSVVASLFFVGPVFAASYADRSSSDLSFTALEETSVTDPTPLFGDPTLSGNVLVFPLPGFVSNVSGGASDITAGTFDVTITSLDKTMKAIEQVLLNEAGDYQLTGSGSSATAASAMLDLQIDVLEVNNGGFVTMSVPASLTGLMASDLFSVDTPVKQDSWGLSASIDVQAAVDAAITAGDLLDHSFATQIRVLWDNQLDSASEPGTNALIQKKFSAEGVRVEIVPTIVPEPATGLLLGLGLTALALAPSRRA